MTAYVTRVFRHRALPWTGLVYFVLTAGVIVLAATLYLIIVELERDTRRVRTEYRDNLTSYATQFERELSTLIRTLDSHHLGEPGATKDELIDRFDVLWSRIEGADEGILGKTYMKFEGAASAVKKTQKVLRKIEPVVMSLDPHDATNHRQIKRELNDLHAKFAQISLLAVHQQNREMTAIHKRMEDANANVLLVFLGVLVGGAIFIILILIEMRHAKALSASLEQRVKERTQDLQNEVFQREQAERQIKKLNEGLEQRVETRTAELRAAQAELLRQERLSTLGQLTATVSHELRNPLAVIRASAFVARDGLSTKGPNVQRALDRIDRSVIRCDRIIDELLDFTRISKIEPELTPIDSWLTEVLDEQTLPTGITMQQDLGLPSIKLPVDRDRFRRAVINVFDNACQAMLREEPGKLKTGELCLTLHTRIHAGRVEIEFEDQGPGILPTILPRIFEPLFSTKGFGVGLGLPVVKQILEQHGGGIEVETAVGCGTRFCLWLPYKG